MPSACVVLAPGAEEIETVTVADLLVRAGCEVTIAAADQPVVRGSRGIHLGAHRSLAEVAEQAFDLVFLPGGAGSAEFCSQDSAVQDFAADQYASGRLLALICACPLALLPRQIASGARLTGYPSIASQMRAGGYDWSESAVVAAGNLITSRGPGTAMGLGLYLAERLCGQDIADSVAAAALTDKKIWPVEVV